MWQTDILAALEAGAAESEICSLDLAALEQAVHLNQTRPGSGIDAGGLALDLLYILITLDLLKDERGAVASAPESVRAEVTPGSRPLAAEDSDKYQLTLAQTPRAIRRCTSQIAGCEQVLEYIEPCLARTCKPEGSR